MVRRAGDEARLAIEELRDLARGIHPAILTNRGLGSALEDLGSRSGLPVEIVAVPDRRLPDQVEAAAYFIVSESLTNAAKHAGASAAWVSATAVNGTLRVEVRDDGSGGAAVGSGSGLTGLEDRVEALDGTLEIHSPSGAGTVLRAEIPLEPLPPEGLSFAGPRTLPDAEARARDERRGRRLRHRLAVIAGLASLLVVIWLLTSAGSAWIVWPLLGLAALAALNAWLTLGNPTPRESDLHSIGPATGPARDRRAGDPGPAAGGCLGRRRRGLLLARVDAARLRTGRRTDAPAGLALSRGAREERSPIERRASTGPLVRLSPTAATRALVQRASSRGSTANRLCGSPGGRPHALVLQEVLVEDHRQVVAERRHAADREAGGRAHLVGGRLAHLGHVERVGQLVGRRCGGARTPRRPPGRRRPRTRSTSRSRPPGSPPPARRRSPCAWMPRAAGPPPRARASGALPATLSLMPPRAPRAPDRRRGEPHAGHVGQLGERGAHVVRELVEVPEHVEVAHEAEVDLAVVGEQRHAQAPGRRPAAPSGTGRACAGPPGRAGTAGPGTFVTTRLKKRWRDIRRAAWSMIVGGANPVRSVSTWAPTAWPPCFRSLSSWRTMSSRASGSWHHTGSGAIIAATRLPSAPRSTSERTLTGIIALSSSPSWSVPAAAQVAARARRPRWPAPRR